MCSVQVLPPPPPSCSLSPEQEAACQCLRLSVDVKRALGSNIYIVLAADAKALKVVDALHYGPQPFGDDFTSKAALWVCKDEADKYELLACHLPAWQQATKLYAKVRVSAMHTPMCCSHAPCLTPCPCLLPLPFSCHTQLNAGRAFMTPCKESRRTGMVMGGMTNARNPKTPPGR